MEVEQPVLVDLVVFAVEVADGLVLDGERVVAVVACVVVGSGQVVAVGVGEVHAEKPQAQSD